ncbi:hypothetical protein [Mangrovicoccus ximenensis]|uniref:hypothetical protein n=1 Tax=Mangrovicoccus ximenensis TaxID=1911570 RepID=UPI000D37AFD4|nr:hypothetical protein [Mangrovicoccus ximenensis]
MSEQTQASATPCAWLHYARPRPHWYLVPEAEKAALKSAWAAVAKAAQDAGAVHQGCFHIRGQHDFETVDIWMFASSQAAYGHWQALVEARYPEYFAFSNGIGLELPGAGDA